MFTKNFNQFATSKLFGVAYGLNENNELTAIGGTKYSSLAQRGDGDKFIDNNAHVASLSRTMYNLSYLTESQFKENNSQGSGVYGVVFGSGNAEATVDDITLSGSPVITYTSTVTQTSSIDENGVAFSNLYTITNTGSEAITIGEVALFSYFYYRNSGSYGTYFYYPFMLERTALEAPVTIEVGGVGQITYTIRMPKPVA